MAITKFAFCHGWVLDQNYNEVTCKVRERCLYFDVSFYRNHGHHMDEFEELFPFEPCGWFLERSKQEVAMTKEEDSFIALLHG